jgi:hypothetical protein
VHVELDMTSDCPLTLVVTCCVVLSKFPGTTPLSVTLQLGTDVSPTLHGIDKDSGVTSPVLPAVTATFPVAVHATETFRLAVLQPLRKYCRLVPIVTGKLAALLLERPSPMVSEVHVTVDVDDDADVTSLIPVVAVPVKALPLRTTASAANTDGATIARASAAPTSRPISFLGVCMSRLLS